MSYGKGIESANNDARKWSILTFDVSRDFIISKEICQTKNLSDSDPDLTSSSLVTFGPNFDCILLHIQNFT